MKIEDEINDYISSQPQAKSVELKELHTLIQQMNTAGKLWFLDGKNSENKVVSNPNIGYGTSRIKYTDGKTRDFYQIGLSANSSGISIYIMGINDKTYLSQTYSGIIGKATVTGYCIKFKTLKKINIDILQAAIRFGFEQGKHPGPVVK